MVQDLSIKLCDITNPGELYTTYDSFFKENNLDDTGYIMQWTPTECYLRNWKIIFKGKHSSYNRTLLVLEKKISNKTHKLIIESFGVSNFRLTKEFINPLIYNNIWK